MKKGFVPAVCVVLLNAAYLYSFDSPTVFYVLNVLAHAGGGLLLTLALARVIRDRFRHWQLETRLAAVAGLLSGVSGAVLIYTGTSRPYLSLLRLHMLLSCLAVILFLASEATEPPKTWLRKGTGVGPGKGNEGVRFVGRTIIDPFAI